MTARDWLHDFTTNTFARAMVGAGFVERGALHALERVVHGAIDEAMDRVEKPSAPPLEPNRNLP